MKFNLSPKLPKLLLATLSLGIVTTGFVINTQVVQAQRNPCQQYMGKGYCTDYIRTRYNIPWRGNAGTWLQNAKNAGWRVGTEPQPGAIAVWTSPGVGHVAIVESVDANSFTVSEQNWGRGGSAPCYVTANFGNTTTRLIQRSRSNVAGFIYP